MSASVDEGYDHWSLRRWVRVLSIMKRTLFYANSAYFSFSKPLTSQSQESIALDPKLHLAINSDRVVTETSSLELQGKNTWGIYYSMVYFTRVAP